MIDPFSDRSCLIPQPVCSLPGIQIRPSHTTRLHLISDEAEHRLDGPYGHSSAEEVIEADVEGFHGDDGSCCIGWAGEFANIRQVLEKVSIQGDATVVQIY